MNAAAAITSLMPIGLLLWLWLPGLFGDNVEQSLAAFFALCASAIIAVTWGGVFAVSWWLSSQLAVSVTAANICSGLSLAGVMALLLFLDHMK